MKIVYLISNNLFTSNIKYSINADIEEKMKYKTLSLDGINKIKNLKLKDIEVVYSASNNACLQSATIFSENNELDTIITNDLNDIVIGNLKNYNLKMLGFFQEKDFDYKLPSGESLNECKTRIKKVVDKAIYQNDIVALFMPRRAIFSYLLDYTDKENNLDDRMVLLHNDKIILGNNEEEIDIIKIVVDNRSMSITKIGGN